MKKRANRGAHPRWRQRRLLPGMLLHIDGGKHRWFSDDRYDDLLVMGAGRPRNGIVDPRREVIDSVSLLVLADW